jgi:hypothetical protein
MPTPGRARLPPEKQVDCPCPGSMARGVYIHRGPWAVTLTVAHVLPLLVDGMTLCIGGMTL